MDCSRGSDFSNLTESKKKNLLHILLPKPKTLLLSLKIKTQEKAFFSKFIRTNQTKIKSKVSFLLIFFKLHLSLTEVKNLKFQVNIITIKMVKILWRKNQYSIEHQTIFYFLYFLIILLFLFFHLVLLFFVCFNSYFLIVYLILLILFSSFFVRFGWRVWPKTLKDFKNHGFLIHGD